MHPKKLFIVAALVLALAGTAIYFFRAASTDLNILSIKTSPTNTTQSDAAVVESTPLVQTPKGTLSRTEFSTMVAPAFDQVKKAQSIHCVIDFTVDIQSSNRNKRYKGIFEYFGKGDLYHDITQYDPTTPNINIESAYDGEHYQLLIKNDRFIRTSKFKLRTKCTFSNPLFLPFDCFSQETEKMASNQITLNQILTESFISERFATAKRITHPDHPNLKGFELPSDTLYYNKQFVYRVYYDDKHPMPVMTESVTKDGTPLRSFSIDYKPYHRNGALEWWPDKIAYSDGVAKATAEYKIQRLDLGDKILNDVFTIDSRLADSFEDADLHKSKDLQETF